MYTNVGENYMTLAQDDDVDDVVLCQDECEFFNNTDQDDNENSREQQRPLYLEEMFFQLDDTNVQPNNERQNDGDGYVSSDDISSGEETVDDPKDFYPFPSKLFFFLYCYVHNICRPQVSRGH